MTTKKAEDMRKINAEKLNLLLDLWQFKEENEHLFEDSGLWIHSILNTIELVVLMDNYIFRSEPLLNNSIESNIKKRLLVIEKPEDTYEELRVQLEGLEYQPHQRVRILLFHILPRLNEVFHKDFFNHFYNSKYSNDISYALKVVSRIWSKEIENKIYSDYNNQGNIKLLYSLINNGNCEILLNDLQEIWEGISFDYLKLRLLSKLNRTAKKDLDFLRILEPDKYLYWISDNKITLSDAELKDCLERTPDYNKGYSVISLGKLEKWNLMGVRLNAD
jgi:hypothetical protein